MRGLLLVALLGCRTVTTLPPDELTAARSPRDLPDEMARGRGVEVLEEQARFEFDAEGRKTYTYKVRYRILDESGIEGWSAISAEWSPWYQERPLLSAFVVGPEGETRELEQASIAEL